jgi:hypothetical protein
LRPRRRARLPERRAKPAPAPLLPALSIISARRRVGSYVRLATPGQREGPALRVAPVRTVRVRRACGCRYGGDDLAARWSETDGGALLPVALAARIAAIRADLAAIDTARDRGSGAVSDQHQVSAIRGRLAAAGGDGTGKATATSGVDRLRLASIAARRAPACCRHLMTAGRVCRRWMQRVSLRLRMRSPLSRRSPCWSVPGP